MNIPTIEEIGRRLDLKRQKKEAAKGGRGGGLTYIDDEEINSLYTLAQLSELESVKEGTRQVEMAMAAARINIQKNSKK